MNETPKLHHEKSEEKKNAALYGPKKGNIVTSCIHRTKSRLFPLVDYHGTAPVILLLLHHLGIERTQKKLNIQKIYNGGYWISEKCMMLTLKAL